jgi:hypothetical protein
MIVPVVRTRLPHRPFSNGRLTFVDLRFGREEAQISNVKGGGIGEQLSLIVSVDLNDQNIKIRTS